MKYARDGIQMRKGNRVPIFIDPFSQEQLEGYAVLVKKVASDRTAQRWLVKFDDGYQVERRIWVHDKITKGETIK